MDYAKAGIDQFRIRPEYKPESPEPLITGDLGIVATKNAETLHGVRYQSLSDFAKAGIDQFRIRPEYEPESPEPLISGDLAAFASKRS